MTIATEELRAFRGIAFSQRDKNMCQTKVTAKQGWPFRLDIQVSPLRANDMSTPHTIPIFFPSTYGVIRGGSMQTTLPVTPTPSAYSSPHSGSSSAQKQKKKIGWNWAQ
ncbi:hypothetical protein AVEN_156422-1 [Araneus ventricosus]|uniref:Uncharacterized protein n=1 Tax=Araneus ventricosus TaxID=182803 RepID=A0A4Y2VLA4_ARAVE|nr:hypothetical protein AVEN_156422-1 [Araneus ventricosus]